MTPIQANETLQELFDDLNTGRITKRYSAVKEREDAVRCKHEEALLFAMAVISEFKEYANYNANFPLFFETAMEKQCKSCEKLVEAHKMQGKQKRAESFVTYLFWLFVGAVWGFLLRGVNL